LLNGRESSVNFLPHISEREVPDGILFGIGINKLINIKIGDKKNVNEK